MTLIMVGFCLVVLFYINIIEFPRSGNQGIDKLLQYAETIACGKGGITCSVGSVVGDDVEHHLKVYQTMFIEKGGIQAAFPFLWTSHAVAIASGSSGF